MSEKIFRLGGEEYSLSKSAVEEKMRNVAPRPLGKYRVLVGGVDYPPKQICSSSGRSLVTFTTMDASRILQALGFESFMGLLSAKPSKNESETLFEQYLEISGLYDFQFERCFPEKRNGLSYLSYMDARRDCL